MALCVACARVVLVGLDRPLLGRWALGEQRRVGWEVEWALARGDTLFSFMRNEVGLSTG